MHQTLIDIFSNSFKLYSDKLALRWRDDNVFKEMTFYELEQVTRSLAAGLLTLKIKKKQHIGLIADVGQNWVISDLAIQQIGAVDIPRGTDSTADELGYIISHSGAKIVFVDHAGEIDKIEKGIKKKKYRITKYIVMDNKVSRKHARKALTMESLIEKGKKALANKNSKEAKELNKRAKTIKSDDLATIIYTSGTTGEPKGVMTTHGNLGFQLNLLPSLMYVSTDDSALTLLPPWHIFGRIAEYLFLAVGCSITYTDVKNIGDDLKTFKPTFVPAVPRIWEGVYNKVMSNVKKSGKEGLFDTFKGVAMKYNHYVRILENREISYKKQNIFAGIGKKIAAIFMAMIYFIPKKLGDVLIFKKVLAATGGNLRASISGGGALPSYIDEFFSAIGVKILEGYGMTETSPIISVRLPERPVPGTVGPIIRDTEYKMIDLEGRDVSDILGAKGTLHIRGPQVMKGYYKNSKKTKEVLSEDGWINTGDLVRINTNGEISIVGRSKDTIVLVGGENVEPTPIEEKLKESKFIDHVMCVGQDEKSIGALLVPNEDELKQYAKADGLSGSTLKEWIKLPEVNKLYKKEVNCLVNADTGFKNFERVTVFRLLTKPFEQGDELNNTLKLKRHVVAGKYQNLVDEMFK